MPLSLVVFCAIFIKKQKALPESTKQTNAEFEKVERIYTELTENDSFDNLKKTYEYYKNAADADNKEQEEKL